MLKITNQINKGCGKETWDDSCKRNRNCGYMLGFPDHFLLCDSCKVLLQQNEYIIEELENLKERFNEERRKDKADLLCAVFELFNQEIDKTKQSIIGSEEKKCQ